MAIFKKYDFSISSNTLPDGDTDYDLLYIYIDKHPEQMSTLIYEARESITKYTGNSKILNKLLKKSGYTKSIVKVYLNTLSEICAGNELRATTIFERIAYAEAERVKKYNPKITATSERVTAELIAVRMTTLTLLFVKNINTVRLVNELKLSHRRMRESFFSVW